MNLLKAEPEGNEYRDKLAVLVASGQAKEMIGIELNQDQIKKNLMKKMLKNTSKDMRFHYPQKLVMQWSTHFLSYHARNWLIFFLLILKDFLLI